MKAFLLSLLGCSVSLATFADRHVNPDYEFRSTAVITPTAVERNNDATKISFHAIYRPNFWIKIDSTAYISDPKTDTHYTPVASEGLVLGQEFWMPDNGETDFSLIFPPIPKEVDAIDFINWGWNIFGLRMDGKKASKTNEIDADEWAKQHYHTYPGEPEQFFNSADTKISGRINGYDPLKANRNIFFCYNNPITGDSNQATIPIAADGSFNISFPMVSPGYFSLSGPGQLHLSCYAEPGRTLDILLDWNDVLQAQINRIMGRESQMPNTRFGGESGEINRELTAAPSAPVIPMHIIGHDSVPSIAQKVILACNDKYKSDINRYKTSATLHPVTMKVMDANVETDLMLKMFDYLKYYRANLPYDSVAPALKEPVTIEFFEPVKKVFANGDPWIFTGQDMGILTDRIELNDIPKLLGAEDYDASRCAEAVTKWVGSDTVPMLWQAAYAAGLCYSDRSTPTQPREESVTTLDPAIENKVISHPYFIKTVNDFFESADNFKPYDIPDDIRGNMLQNIVVPYFEQFILIDFWGTSCDASRADIENSAEMRQRNINHPNFKMIFITGEGESPENVYNEYVSKSLAGETTIRLSDSDFNRLRDLFKINDIPHYVLIGPYNKILNEEIHFPSLSNTLYKYGITLK